jgi:hypothetical protein
MIKLIKLWEAGKIVKSVAPILPDLPHWRLLCRRQEEGRGAHTEALGIHGGREGQPAQVLSEGPL